MPERLNRSQSVRKVHVVSLVQARVKLISVMFHVCRTLSELGCTVDSSKLGCTVDSSKLGCTVDYSNYVILLTQLILHNVATQLTHFLLQNVPAVDSSKLA